MNRQSFAQRFFRYVPALFTLTALGLVGWAVVDRPAPSTTAAAAVPLTTTSTADSASSAADADVRRRIEDVRVGDLVWAYDEQTGQLEKRPVTALFRSQTDHLRVLTLESESGQRQRIETTDEHPFWVVGYGWQDAQLLRPGNRLLEPDQSQVTVIASVREEHPDGLTVYNFEVAGLRDYFVSATATDSLVLSHNMCSKASAPKETLLPDSYWIDRQAPTQVTPGTRTVNVDKPSSSGGTYHSTPHYDEFGRQIGQTHRTHHGYSNPESPQFHPNPHHHRRNPITGEKLKDPQTGSRTWPGLFGNEE